LFNPFTLLVGPVLVAIIVYKSTKPVSNGGFHLPWWLVTFLLFPTGGFADRPLRNVILSYMVWLTATRTAKLIPHLWHRPQDIIYVPAFILFGYYFAVMKVYALLTLHEVGGSLCCVRFLQTPDLSVLDWLGYKGRYWGCDRGSQCVRCTGC
jgi:hypothetical protein